MSDGSCTVEFNQPAKAITEDQFVVFYKEEQCLGEGIIDKAIR
ncbi:MAG: hypothetical protein N4A48_03795 [Tepidibacter sp.]|nr:aminomethyltransferase beta-barrel domain-containing protein [Tepidibacter sp.]MCT4507872.1 hypothetical protein [Tepidibacter sp.]